jgi:hypothetical protein
LLLAGCGGGGGGEFELPPHPASSNVVQAPVMAL